MVAPTPNIDVPEAALAEFCRRWDVVEFGLFGSVLRDDFGPESDVDVILEFAPEARRSIRDLLAIDDELAELFGRKVDVLERSLVEKDPNWIRRRSILGGSRVIYDAR
jgi:uncharacterized protein